MCSETTKAAEDFRLQEWACQIRDCQNRPAGMSVIGWCAANGITKTCYYYRLRRVRKACLEQIQNDMAGRQIVPVRTALLKPKDESPSATTGLDISAGGISVHVTESTSMALLASVLEVIRNAE